MGCCNLQLWIPCIRSSLEPSNPATATGKVHGKCAPNLGGLSYCPYWREKLCWDTSLEIHSWNGRSGCQPLQYAVFFP